MYSLTTSILLRNNQKYSMGFIDLDEVMAVESLSNEIWIYAYNLAWESESSKLPDLVLENLERGAKYRYIVPNNKQVTIRVNALRLKYSEVKNNNQLIKFRNRQRDLKLVQFGIAIYNPSILSGGSRSIDDCVVVFFPHYQSFGPSKSPLFITMKGQSTVEIQEGFIELWDETEEVPWLGKKEI